MHKESAMGRHMISLLRPCTPLGRMLLATAAALWATLLIVAWAPGPGPESTVDAAEAPPGPSAWLALATAGVLVVAGVLHVRRHR
jgi:hypothetical protein